MHEVRFSLVTLAARFSACAFFANFPHFALHLLPSLRPHPLNPTTTLFSSSSPSHTLLCTTIAIQSLPRFLIPHSECQGTAQEATAEAAAAVGMEGRVAAAAATATDIQMGTFSIPRAVTALATSTSMEARRESRVNYLSRRPILTTLHIPRTDRSQQLGLERLLQRRRRRLLQRRRLWWLQRCQRRLRRWRQDVRTRREPQDSDLGLQHHA